MPVFPSSQASAVQTDVLGSSSTLGSGFTATGTAGHVEMVSRTDVVANLGTTGLVIPTGSNTYVLEMTSPAGFCVLNASQPIPSGYEVQIDFWACTPEDTIQDVAAGLTTLAREENRNPTEYLALQKATNSTFNLGLSEISGVRWKRSTTNLNEDAYTDLSVDGRIRGDELPTYTASSITLNAYRITFTSDGSYYRFANISTHGGGTYDHMFIHDMKVMITPPAIDTSSPSNDRNYSPPAFAPFGHASVCITTNDMPSTPNSFNTYAMDGQGAGLAVLSIAEGVKFDATSGRFTVTSKGMYKVTAVTYCHALSQGGALNQSIRKNDSLTDLISTSTIGSNADHYCYVLTGILSLDAYDYITHISDSAGPGSSQMRINRGSTFTIRRIA